MSIASIDATLYRIPVPANVSDAAHGTLTTFELIAATVRDSDGAEGMGFTYTMGVGGSSILALLRDDLAPSLIGEDGDATERLWEQLWWRTHYVGRGGIAAYALSVLDIALWDLKARRAKLPLWRLLGGYDSSVPAYGAGINYGFSQDALVEQMHSLVAQGLRAVKMKVGKPHLFEDLDRVAAVREALGPHVQMMVDATMRWDVTTAVRAARELSAYDLTWLEDPVDPDDLPGHVRVIMDGGVPVSAGKNYHTMFEFERLIALGGASVPAANASNVGGVTPFLKIAALAKSQHLNLSVHGIEELNAHLLAAVPNRSMMVVGLLNGTLERFRVKGLRILDGCVVAPERPGHGLELDWEHLARHKAS